MAIVEQRHVMTANKRRLDQVVRDLTQRSHADVRGIVHYGYVSVNGAIATDAAKEVRPGDVILVRHDPQTRYREPPKERGNNAYRLVFEDEHLIVVDKAAGVLTVPTDHGETSTLLSALNQYVGRRRGRVVVVHRLDRGTSGLLVFAKNQRIASALQDQFKIHKADREYAALVAGIVPQKSGTFSGRLGTTKSLQRYTTEDEGESAVTHYRVERHLGDATYVRVQLETGRRNQIRVHFADAGHPVLGDDRYGIERSAHPRWKWKRLALHAATLGFVHPVTKEKLVFESPLPGEFERFLAGKK